MPCSWIPPWQACELRALEQQLYRDLAEEHMAQAQWIHATLSCQGVPGLAGRLSDPRTRALPERGQDLGLSPASAQAVAAAPRRLEDLEAKITPVRRQIASSAHAVRHAGARRTWLAPISRMESEGGSCTPSGQPRRAVLGTCPIGQRTRANSGQATETAA